MKMLPLKISDQLAEINKKVAKRLTNFRSAPNFSDRRYAVDHAFPCTVLLTCDLKITSRW